MSTYNLTRAIANLTHAEKQIADDLEHATIADAHTRETLTNTLRLIGMAHYHLTEAMGGTTPARQTDGDIGEYVPDPT